MAREVDQTSHRSVAQRVVRATTQAEQKQLLLWAQGLLEIRKSSVPVRQKVASAIKLTMTSKATWPLIKVMSVDLKRVGWDERSWKARLGLWGAVATVAVVGNAGAGIAALGGAIGVPLWIVIGAGGVFAGVLVDELLRSLAASSAVSGVMCEEHSEKLAELEAERTDDGSCRERDLKRLSDRR